MFIQVTIFFAIFHCILTQDTNTVTLDVDICDDALLKGIQQSMELLQTKTDSLEEKMQQHFEIHRNELKTQWKDLKSAASSKTKTMVYGSDDTPDKCLDSCSNLFKQCNEEKILGSDCTCPFPDKDKNLTEWDSILVVRNQQRVFFNQTWETYKNGFGVLGGEVFLGLNTVHRRTSKQQHELWVKMEDYDGTVRWARYNNFLIGSEDEGFVLKSIGKYTGDAGDALKTHVGQKFSTHDRDNDQNNTISCSEQSGRGGWWFTNCGDCCFTGLDLRGKVPDEQRRKGIHWKYFHGHDYSLKYVHMAMRPIE